LEQFIRRAHSGEYEEWWDKQRLIRPLKRKLRAVFHKLSGRSPKFSMSATSACSKCMDRKMGSALGPVTKAFLDGVSKGRNPARARRRTLGRRIRAAWRGLRWAFALGLVKAAFYVAKAGGRPYESVEIGGRRFNNVRDSDRRWRAVAEVLDRHAVHNVLDVGCAEGWFVRRAAKDHNCFAVGIEATDALCVGELARLHDRVERAATIRAFMTPEALRRSDHFAFCSSSHSARSSRIAPK
jgi:hypothetical protein